jgi:hypothetical protein
MLTGNVEVISPETREHWCVRTCPDQYVVVVVVAVVAVVVVIYKIAILL